MKKWIQCAALMLTLLMLTGCGGGDTRTHGRQIRPSERYDEATIADAMDVVEKHFQKNFKGCTLHTIVYDEAATTREMELVQEQYGEDTIILKTDFYVDDSGASPSLNPGQTYKNYSWTLTRTLFGWELKDWGYA